MSRTMNMHTTVSIAKVIDLAHRGAVVSIVDNGDVQVGTARHVVVSPDNPAFPSQTDDVRDCFLRVTMRSGFERFIPVERAATLLHFGEMSEGDFSS